MNLETYVHYYKVSTKKKIISKYKIKYWMLIKKKRQIREYLK